MSSNSQPKKAVMYIGVATAVVLLAALIDSFSSSDKDEVTAASATMQDSAPGKPATSGSSSAEENLKPIGTVKVAENATAGVARSGEEVYKAACMACHGTGVLNAPKLEKADWEPRVGKGLDGLIGSAVNGFNAMPPRGGNPDITDEEISNAIVYMAGQAGHDLSDQVKATQTAAGDRDSAGSGSAASAQGAPAKPDAPAAPQAPAVPVAPIAPVASPAPAAPAAPQAPAAPAASAEAPATPEPVTQTEVPVPAVAQEQVAAPAAQEAAPATASVDGEKVYKSICFSCHDVGIANSPKLGDKAAWESRLVTGIDVLYGSALNGKNAMPAKGGNPALSDAEVKAAVDWMVAQ